MEGPFPFWPVQQSCKAALSQLELGPRLAPLGPLRVSASQAPALSQNGTWAPVARARLWEEPTGRAWWREAWGRGNGRKGAPGPIPPTAPEPALAQISRPSPNQLQFGLTSAPSSKSHSSLSLTGPGSQPQLGAPVPLPRPQPCPQFNQTSVYPKLSSSSANPRPNP